MEVHKKEKLYIRVRDGKFERQALPGDPPDKVLTRKRADNTTYDVCFFEGLKVIFTGVGVYPWTWKDKTYDIVHFSLCSEDGEERVLQVDLKSRYATDILQRIENIEIGQLYYVGIGYDIDKDTHFIWIKKDHARGEKVPMRYTSVDPGARPAWIKHEIGDKVLYDRAAEQQWWKALIVGQNARLSGTVARDMRNNATDELMKEDDEEHVFDDLPF